jgi:mannobiose 2-epimerase
MVKLILRLLIFISLSANYSFKQENTSKTYPDVRLNLLKKEVTENLTKNILSYWSSEMVDKVNGGFYGRIDASDRIFPNEDKGGILNARILWTYSAAYRVLNDTSCLRLATYEKDYILDHFIDNEYGGAYRTVNAKGEPSDSRKQTYTQSFFIYGLAEYFRATGDKKALSTAIDIFNSFEKYAIDRESNGYFEVFSRDWHRTRDRLIGERSINDEKTMNTHLHLMEAYAGLYRIWPDKRLEGKLRNLVDIFLDKIIDKKSSHLICFLNRNWNSTSTIDSYGHDIEASWLLYEAADLLKDPALLARVKEISLKIADAASEGLQPDGSMIDEKDHASGETRSERSWWPQAETIVGYTNAWELTGDIRYLNKVVSNWNYTKKYFVDSKNGGWYSSVSEKGLPGKGDKGGFWVCPYHNGRMCLEIIERIK